MSDWSGGPSYNTPISPRAPMWLTPEERAAGITKDLKVAARRYLCPNCGREFSLFQSRAVACKACPRPVPTARTSAAPTATRSTPSRDS